MAQRAAIVTGASSGIGLAVARVLGEEGYGVTMAARRADKLEAAVAGLAGEGHDVQAVAANVADEEAIQQIVGAHRARYGRLDVLVNNAGVGFGAQVGEIKTKHLDMQLRSTCARSCCSTANRVPDLLAAAGEHKNALVVNTSSISGKFGQGWLSVYSATKHGVVGWTEAMNKELAPAGDQVHRAVPRVRRYADDRVRQAACSRRGDDPARGHRRGRAVSVEGLPRVHRPGDDVRATGRRPVGLMKEMKLGVHIGYWGLGLTSQEQLKIVQEAERLGYDSVWAAEAYGSDTATVLGWLAGQTSKIRLGSGIFQMPGRSAAMTAMTAATIDQLSNGRMILGIGSSGPQVAEGWHGQRFGKQLQRTREYVAVIRMALARERVEFHGETLELPLPDGPGKALKLTIAPVQERIPIYLAAIGPKNTALAGEIADGWIPTLFSPEHVSELRPLLEEGAARSGKSLEGFDMAPTVQVFVTDDMQAARDGMRPFIALYVGGMGSRKQNFYNQLVQRYGFEAEAKTIQDLYLEGKREEAMAAIPDALIDSVSLCGPPDVVRERLAVYRDAGVGTLGVTPIAFTAAERLEQLRLVAELAAA